MSVSTPSSTLSKLFNIIRKGSVFFILLVIIALLSTFSEQFLSVNNLFTIGLQTSMIALVGIGMTFVIITAGIDLSVGSITAFCGALAAGLAIRNHLGSYPAIAISLGVGAFLGMINGALIVWGRIPPFVAT